jgi:putative transposase
MSKYIHLVFNTKYRLNTISAELMRCFQDCFKEYLSRQSIEMLACNGHQNHIHLLIKFDKDIDLPKIVQALKGGVARQINISRPNEDKFKWSVGYFAQRINYSRVYDLIGYIENQKEHHKKAPD